MYQHLATQLTKQRLLEQAAAASTEVGDDSLAAIHELLLRVERAGIKAISATEERRRNYSDVHGAKLEVQLGIRTAAGRPMAVRRPRAESPSPSAWMPPRPTELVDAPRGTPSSAFQRAPPPPPLPSEPPPRAALSVGEGQWLMRFPPAIAEPEARGPARFVLPRVPRSAALTPSATSSSLLGLAAAGDDSDEPWLQRAATAAGLDAEFGSLDDDEEEGALGEGFAPGAGGVSAGRIGPGAPAPPAEQPAAAPDPRAQRLGSPQQAGRGASGSVPGGALSDAAWTPAPGGAPHAAPSEEECAAAAARLASHDLFGGWDAAQLRELVGGGGGLAWRELARYAVLHREGQRSLSFCIIVSGGVALTSSRRPGEERALGPGDTFGHAALVLHPREAPLPHLHTAVTQRRTWLLVLTHAALRASARLRALFACDAPAGAVGGAAERALCGLLADRLSTFTIFADIARAKMLRLARLFSYAELPPGHVLTREGHRSTRFCLLLSGSVAVTKRAAEAARPDVTLAVIDAGAEMPYFGENCILSAQIEAPSGATVATREASQLFVVYREAAQEFLSELPEFGNILLERKAMLRRTNQRIVEGAAINTTIVPGKRKTSVGGAAPSRARPKG